MSALAIEAATGKGRFLLPSPDLVWAAFIENPPYFLKGFRVTLITVVLGLAIGAALGLWLTVLLALSRGLRFWLLPLLVISQAIPVFALAPLLVQWLLGARAQGRHDHADPVLSRHHGFLGCIARR